MLLLIMGQSAYAQAAAQNSQKASEAKGTDYRTALNRYCVTCHNEKLKTAGLMLDKIQIETPSQNPEIWEKVITKLRTASMPPVGLPRPDKATYNALATYLETDLDRAAAANLNPGRPAPSLMSAS